MLKRGLFFYYRGAGSFIFKLLIRFIVRLKWDILEEAKCILLCNELKKGVSSLIDPVALKIGTLTIYWYGLLISLALLAGTLVALYEIERVDISQDFVVNLILLATPLAVIGARAYYVLFNLEYYRQDWGEIFAIWHGGLAIHGALLTAFLTAWAYAKHKQVDFWKVADVASPSILLGVAVGRWGNYFNQDAYGTPTDLPWAMYIAWEMRHPTFLYESLWCLLGFMLLIWLSRNKFIQKGEIFLSFILYYSFGRFFIEMLRTDSLMIGAFRVAHVVSLVLILLAAGIWWRRRRCNAVEQGASALTPSITLNTDKP